MEYRPLGRTGLDVSVICLGTMTFGEQNSEAEAHAQLDYAVDQGVNFIDAAEMYPVPPRAETQGLTEQYLGSWLAGRGRRDDIILATKVTGPGQMDWIRSGPRLSAEQVTAAIDTSLQRLQTDYIDLYQVHWPERQTNYFGKLGYTGSAHLGVPIEETLTALDRARQAGKIRHIGISNETPWGVAEYLRLANTQGLPRVASIQNPFNLLNRTFEIGLAEFAEREAVGLLAYSPLAFGTLSGKYLDNAQPARARLTLYERFKRYTGDIAERSIGRYVHLAREHGLDPAQMALAWVNSRPFLTSNIIGATTMDQLRSNIASADLKLPPAVREQIEAIHASQPNPCP